MRFYDCVMWVACVTGEDCGVCYMSEATNKNRNGYITVGILPCSETYKVLSGSLCYLKMKNYLC